MGILLKLKSQTLIYSIETPVSNHINMKVCIVLLALVACCAAVDLDRIIAAEVKQILHDNHGISVSDCSSKCDALFDLVAGHDEGLTDRECQAACDQAINGGHHGGHGNHGNHGNH